MWRIRRCSTSTVACLVGCALLVITQRSISDPIGGILTSLIFLGTILVAGICGGWKAGISATLLGFLTASFLFSPPYFYRFVFSSVHFLRLLSLITVGVILSGICELLHRAWRRIEDRQRQLENEICERRRLQVAEQARADEFLTTLASIGDGVIRADHMGRVTFLNPVAEELVGWKSDQAAGRMLSEVFHIVNDVTRQPVENPAVQALREGRIVNLVDNTILISREGKERAIDDSAAPIRDVSGKVIGTVLVFRDISQRQRDQAALRESEQRYRAIGESIDYGVWCCDAAGRNTFASEAFLRLVGLTQKECSTFGWTSVLHPDDAEETVAAWKDCVRTGGRWDREHRFKGVDGNWHHILARGVPITNDKGEVTSWVGINLDISRLKEVEAELRENDRRKDEFLATLAHELRNPLAPIMNALEILKLPSVNEQSARVTREIMQRQVHHLVRLVDDLLDLSRVMQGKIELRRERVELSAVIERAIETVQPLIDARGHQLVISLPARPLVLHADPVRLAQVVGNLLTNAAKYTPPKGQILLTAQGLHDRAEFRVQDNGIGIKQEMLPQIFGLFVQADHSSTSAEGGLGIGLTLVRNLVDMHGGYVEARSNGLGHGSEFVVQLPLAADPGKEPVEPASKAPCEPTSLRGFRLLVVDDNHDAASSLTLLLEMQGHEVRVAHTGLDALKTVTTFVPDLVFLDIGMPEMDGYEVARRMRRTASLKNTVLAALTGWGQADDRKRSADAGFDHHLMKPPEARELEMLIASLKRS